MKPIKDARAGNPDEFASPKSIVHPEDVASESHCFDRSITRDRDIRDVLIRDLQNIFPDPTEDLILQEFGCKTVRIDVAVINGALHGFEIKSDSDSLARLPLQAKEYSKIFDFMTLVCGPKLFRGASLIIPEWWGLQLARLENANVSVVPIREPRKNPSQCNQALARMLWKKEALRCLRQNGHKGVTSKDPAEEVWAAAATLLPTRTLANEARLAIKARGGSGFAKRSTPNDDLCTIESSSPDFRLQNLDWLLSQLSPNPLG
jgi:hypothetical protein